MPQSLQDGRFIVLVVSYFWGMCSVDGSESRYPGRAEELESVELESLEYREQGCVDPDAARL